jgi:hypothetical protein
MDSLARSGILRGSLSPSRKDWGEGEPAQNVTPCTPSGNGAQTRHFYWVIDATVEAACAFNARRAQA